MIVLDVFMAWIQLEEPSSPAWPVVLRTVAAVWFTLASALIIMAYHDTFLVPSPRASRPAVMILSTGCTFVARLVQLGTPPPFMEWPHIFTIGLVMGWALYMTVRGDGGHSSQAH